MKDRLGEHGVIIRNQLVIMRLLKHGILRGAPAEELRKFRIDERIEATEKFIKLYEVQDD